MPQSTLLRLPRERAAQLRYLSSVTGQPMTEVVGDMLARELHERGLLHLPGFTVERVETDGAPMVRFAVDTVSLIWVPGHDALALAEAIYDVAESTRPAFAKTIGVDSVKVSRVGTGVAIEIFDSGPKARKARRVVARSVARDLARELRIAATPAA